MYARKKFADNCTYTLRKYHNIYYIFFLWYINGEKKYHDNSSFPKTI